MIVVQLVNVIMLESILKSSSTKRIVHKKSNNTLKKLIFFCTKSGSISEAYAGSCTDRFITEDTNIFAKFTPGFMVLFDIGFNVQDLLLSRQMKCVLTPFVRSKRQFTLSEVYQGKRIARERIHIERVMGKLKEFRLLNHVLPINMTDRCDHLWNVAGAICEYAACFG